MKLQTIVLAAIGLLSFIMGVVEKFPALYLLSIFISGFLVFYWYRLDAEEKNYRRSRPLNSAVVVIAIFALPYYFFQSRGAKGGLIALGKFILAFSGSGALTIAGQYVALHALQN